jgi:tetratricopeptide (TPR) repeat protein
MTYAKLGEIEECLRLNEEAIATAERTGDMQAAANLLRAYGEALLLRGRSQEARHQCERGLKLASAQHASFEERRFTACIERLAP